MPEFDSQISGSQSGGLQDEPRRPGWVDAIRDAADDPDWPPLPTLASGGGLPTGGGAGSKPGAPLRIRPRGVGGRSDGENGKGAEEVAAVAQDVVIHFHCPSCFEVMEVHLTQVNLDVTCERCLALVAPPRVVRR